MPKYRVFIEDVGPERFSALHDVEADSPHDAVEKLSRYPVRGVTRDKPRLIALPIERTDLWPDAQGNVPAEALNYK